MSKRTQNSLPKVRFARHPGYVMSPGRLTDVDRRPAPGKRQPAIRRASPTSTLTALNARPYIRFNRTRTPMCSSKPTHHRILTAAALAWIAAFSLYCAGGCASGKSAKGNAALDAYVQGVLAYQKGDTDKA